MRSIVIVVIRFVNTVKNIYKVCTEKDKVSQMGFMDDISMFTKGVGQKAKGNYDIVTMNNRIASLQKEISNVHTQIGKKYYELYAQTPNEELKEFVERIVLLEKEIDMIKQQIEDTKTATAAVQLTASSGETGNGVRFCKVCGTQLSEGALFCTSCGTKVE